MSRQTSGPCVVTGWGMSGLASPSRFLMKVQSKRLNPPQPAVATSVSVSTEEPIMMTLVLRFLADDTGATAIEYGLIAAGIAVAIIATVQALGTNLNSTFSTVSTSLK
jgi:pilus assembly protein Flp/PilA